MLKLIPGKWKSISLLEFLDHLPFSAEFHPTRTHSGFCLLISSSVVSWWWQTAPTPGLNINDSWRLIRARSREVTCWWRRAPGWSRMFLTMMIWVASMSRMALEVGGPANTTHSWGWGWRAILVIHCVEVSSHLGDKILAVQLCLVLVWNRRARDGHGSESTVQWPQSSERKLFYFNSFSQLIFTKWSTIEANSSIWSAFISGGATKILHWLRSKWSWTIDCPVSISVGMNWCKVSDYVSSRESHLRTHVAAPLITPIVTADLL